MTPEVSRGRSNWVTFVFAHSVGKNGLRHLEIQIHLQIVPEWLILQ